MFYNMHLVLIHIVNYYVYTWFFTLHVLVGFVDVFLIGRYTGGVCFFFNL